MNKACRYIKIHICVEREQAATLCAYDYERLLCFVALTLTETREKGAIPHLKTFSNLVLGLGSLQNLLTT